MKFDKIFLQQIWGEMVRGKKPPEDRPELLFSLNYLPQAERLTIVILSAKHLPTTHDVYTKVTFANSYVQSNILNNYLSILFN